MTQHFAEELFANGFTDLVSVIPPDAQLSPNSKIPQTAIGKVPGRRSPTGLWSGYNWRKHEPTAADVRSWCAHGANIGLRADRFPGVDIDCHDEQLVRIITQAALATLGPAPVRIGRAPKQLLMYRTAEPFGRMRLWIDDKHLVEILGQGQQYLVFGTHPGTRQPYEWMKTPPRADELTLITREQADAFLVELMGSLGAFATVEREGDGKPITRSAALDQESLHAPSVAVVREAVALIPNSNEFFPDRTDYLRMGYAIRAAVGEDHADEGLEIFEEWAAKWAGNGRIERNDPEVVYADWRRMTGQKSVGWPWLAEYARRFGFKDAVLEFSVLRDRPDDSVENDPKPEMSDRGLADTLVNKLRDDIRVVNQTDKFLVWHEGKWSPDEERLAEWMIHDELAKMGTALLRHGATDDGKNKNYGQAMALCSMAKAQTVTAAVKLHRALNVSLAMLDQDKWIINTPGGIVDLLTGAMGPSRREAFCTKATSVTPEFGGDCPEWKRFLQATTRGDAELIGYLRRLCGYCLTGSTQEQHLTFIWGEGGNGKGTFLGVLSGILADYWTDSSMDAFTAGNEGHPTELARMVGARLVTASETEAGKRWAEARVKKMTGGDPITARFMRQDFFTFRPQFKLVFIGNHQPEIRNVDEAMRRRIQMVPFIVRPEKVDQLLGDKLREEYPAILAWMIEGCLEWQRMGLCPPSTVRAETERYFDDEDEIGRWVRDCCEVGATFTATSADLFGSWEQWARGNGVKFIGSVKRVASALKTKGFSRWEEPGSRRQGFAGLRPRNRQEFEIV